MGQPTRMILAAVLFAAALIASSYLLRGQSIGDWVDAAIYLALAAYLAFEWATGFEVRPCRIAPPHGSGSQRSIRLFSISGRRA